jgi:hypothetical protein
MKTHRFLKMDGDALRKAFGLATETPFQHPDPLKAGQTIPAHSHQEDNVYVVTGRAKFTVLTEGDSVVESRFLGDDEEHNAVFIPGGMKHEWTEASDGARIWDVQYEERTEKVLQVA